MRSISLWPYLRNSSGVMVRFLADSRRSSRRAHRGHQRLAAVPHHADLSIVGADQLSHLEVSELLGRRRKQREVIDLRPPGLRALELGTRGFDQLCMGVALTVDGRQPAMVGHGMTVDEAI